MLFFKFIILLLFSTQIFAEEYVQKDYCFYKRKTWIDATEAARRILKDENGLGPIGTMPLALYHKLPIGEDINSPIMELKEGKHCFYVKSVQKFHDLAKVKTDLIREKWEKDVVINDDLKRPVRFILTKQGTYYSGGLDIHKLDRHAEINFIPKEHGPVVLSNYHFKQEWDKFKDYIGPISPNMRELKPLEDFHVRANYVYKDIIKFTFTLGSKTSIFYLGENEALELAAVYMTMKNQFPIPWPDMLSGLADKEGKASTYYGWPTHLCT